jgi:hypothetical protein
LFVPRFHPTRADKWNVGGGKPAQQKMVKTKNKNEETAADYFLPRWGGINDATRHFPVISRSRLYELIDRGLIGTRVIRFNDRPNATGRRAIDLWSLRSYINACPKTATKAVRQRLATTVAIREIAKARHRAKRARKTGGARR